LSVDSAKRALIALLLLLAGCAGRETEALVAAPQGLPPAARVAGVPFHPQGEDYCGPASLAMALGWAGRTAPPSIQVYTPGKAGSLTTDMEGAARRQGMLAVRLRSLGQVLAELAAGRPVVVFQNLGLEVQPRWHFAVATGYDLPGRRLTLHSGFDPDLDMSLDTFEHTWARAGRWALAVLPPDQLPMSAAVNDAVDGAAGLERAGRAAEAAQAYAAILERWPDSLAAAIGLGNALYAAGRIEAAEAAFRQAVLQHPQAAAAWNNLAHVLLERGHAPEAEASALRAVGLDAESETYAATLAEIRTSASTARRP
jgi:hypothetical protein